LKSALLNYLNEVGDELLFHSFFSQIASAKPFFFCVSRYIVENFYHQLYNRSGVAPIHKPIFETNNNKAFG
jgi:hypothetical protein